jgi:uncharacterized protein YjbI with pentapeptide repeats
MTDKNGQPVNNAHIKAVANTNGDPHSEARTYVYRLPQRKGLPDKKGELTATDADEAQRQLRLELMTPALPRNLELFDKAEIDAALRQRKSDNLRQLLDILRDHHLWLRGEGGERAVFCNRDFSGLKLPRLDLSMANLSGCDFSGADLSATKLQGTDLSGVNFAEANLGNADLSQADLSDADLRSANLTGACLDGTDIWRANLMGAEVAPDVLHRLLDCRHPGSNRAPE